MRRRRCRRVSRPVCEAERSVVRQSAPSLVRSAFFTVVPCGVNGRSAARARRILPGRHGRRPAINHNAGDYTQPSRASSAPGPPSSRGPSSYNLHYGVRPACWRRVRPPSLAALATSSSSANGLKGSRPDGLCLKGFMPARLRLAAAARSRSSLLVPASPASAARPGRRGHAKPSSSFRRQRPGAPQGVACGPRQPAPGRPFVGHSKLRPPQRPVKSGNDSGSAAE